MPPSTHKDVAALPDAVSFQIFAPVFIMTNGGLLNSTLGLNFVPWNWLMAVSAVVILPAVLLFFGFQRYFVEGVTFVGSKG